MVCVSVGKVRCMYIHRTPHFSYTETNHTPKSKFFYITNFCVKSKDIYNFADYQLNYAAVPSFNM